MQCYDQRPRVLRGPVHAGTLGTLPETCLRAAGSCACRHGSLSRYLHVPYSATVYSGTPVRLASRLALSPSRFPPAFQVPSICASHRSSSKKGHSQLPNFSKPRITN